MRLEPRIGVRPNGVFLVFGQTAMFFYLVHRLAFEIPATLFRPARRRRSVNDLYRGGACCSCGIYPPCRWYRTVKAAHPASLLKYF